MVDVRVPALVASTALALTVALVGCSPPRSDILTDPVLIGITTDSPGVNYQDPVSGARSGFDVSMYQWIAQEEGFRPQEVELAVSEREEALIRGGDAGGVDLVVATYSITTPREPLVDFAGPYLETRQGVMMHADDPRRITNPSELSGRTVCAESGSTSIRELRAIPGAIVSERDTLVQCIQDLRDRRIDVVSTDWMVLDGWADSEPDVLRLESDVTFGAIQQWGIGLPPEDGAANCELVTDVLEKFMASGAWETMFTNNFGDDVEPENFKPKQLNPCVTDPDPEADAIRDADD
jgi:glutamate transport system substrate-binding protein